MSNATMNTLHSSFEHTSLKDGSTLGISAQYFDLPRELRDKIYAYLWSATPSLSFTFDYHPFDHFPSSTTYILSYGKNMPLEKEASYSEFRDRNRKLPQWLMINKTILAEGCAEFKRCCTITMRIWMPNLLQAEKFIRFVPNKISSLSWHEKFPIAYEKFKSGSNWDVLFTSTDPEGLDWNRVPYAPLPYGSVLPPVDMPSPDLHVFVENWCLNKRLEKIQFHSFQYVSFLDSKLRRFEIEDAEKASAQGFSEPHLLKMIKYVQKALPSVPSETSERHVDLKDTCPKRAGRGCIWRFAFACSG